MKIVADNAKIAKALRLINLGIVDIMKIIEAPCEKRNSDDLFHLAVYLMDRVEFFKNSDFLDKDFMYTIAERVKCEKFR